MSGKPRIAPEHWPQIAARYAAGEDAEAIGQEFGVKREAIYLVVRRSGGQVKYRGGSDPITEDKVKIICEEYKSGRGATSIAVQLGIHKRSVYNILTRCGIGTRPVHDRTGDSYHIPDYQQARIDRPRLGHKRGPRGAFNLDAFAVLDDEAAYWVGYLITDGNIGAYEGRSYRLTLVQARKHREQCEKLAKYLGSDLRPRDGANVTFDKLRDFSTSSFTLPDMVAQRLLALGIQPAKTGTASAPEALRSNPAFWRGVIEGDGSVYAKGIRMNSSSPRLAGQFRRFARTVVDPEAIKVYRNQAGVWGVYVARVKDAADMARVLYADASVSLQRKHEFATRLMQKYGTNKPQP